MMGKTLAQKVDWLFDVRRTAHGRQFTYGQIQRATGNRITASYVWKLRTGAMHNPGLSALEALADVFQVPLDYFAEGGEYLEEGIRLTQAIPTDQAARRHALQLLTEHAEDLSDQALQAVLGVTEYLRTHETRAENGAPAVPASAPA